MRYMIFSLMLGVAGLTGCSTMRALDGALAASFAADKEESGARKEFWGVEKDKGTKLHALWVDKATEQVKATPNLEAPETAMVVPAIRERVISNASSIYPEPEPPSVEFETAPAGANLLDAGSASQTAINRSQPIPPRSNVVSAIVVLSNESYGDAWVRIMNVGIQREHALVKVPANGKVVFPRDVPGAPPLEPNGRYTVLTWFCNNSRRKTEAPLRLTPLPTKYFNGESCNGYVLIEDNYGW